MKTVRLDRSDTRLYQRDPGKLGERLVSENYSSYSPALAENFDLASKSGTVVEVKSTQTRLSNGNKGRFRLFKNQHEKLVRAARGGGGYYVFVLVDVSGRPLRARMLRKDPATIGRVVGARGGWDRSGHPSGLQKKLPYSAIF